MSNNQERAEIPGSHGRLDTLRQLAAETANKARQFAMDPGKALELLKSLEYAGPKDATTEIIVVVRRRCATSDLPPLERYNAVDTVDRHYFTRAEYATKYGSDPRDIDRVVEFAQQNKLTVVDDKGNEVSNTSDPEFINDCASRRMLRIAGMQKNIDKAFAIVTKHLFHEGDLHRVHAEPVSVPVALDNIVQWVFGLETQSVPRASSHMAALTASKHQLGKANIRPLKCPEVASHYQFPDEFDGTGESIGILEPYGGYYEQDMDTYFGNLGMQKPRIVTVGANNPDWYEKKGLSMGNIEVTLDVQVASALAPGATTVVYLPARCSDINDAMPKRLYEIMSKAIYDDDYKPSALSLSWGGAETSWKTGDRLQLDELFRDAVCLGITICVSSGDSGVAPPASKAGIQAPPVTVYPASNPHVLSCGGTSLESYDIKTSTYGREVVWNDHSTTLLVGSTGKNSDNEPIMNHNGAGASGGGVSNYYPLPDYQIHADVPKKTILNWTNGEVHSEAPIVGRGVPDVAASADLHTGYELRFNGKLALGGGSSAAAPVWAGLVARINQGLGRRVGFLNPVLYHLQLTKGPKVCREITQGNNGGYDARHGWDACTGLGSPLGSDLLIALASGGPGA